MPYQRDALARRSMIVETFETATTWDRFPEFHAAVTAAAKDTINPVCGAGRGVAACRFTHVYHDGPALYYGIYAGGGWGRQLAQWDEIKAAVSEAISPTGGAITHHHAVGRDHRPQYDRQRPVPFAAALRAAKTTLNLAGVQTRRAHRHCLTAGPPGSPAKGCVGVIPCDMVPRKLDLLQSNATDTPTRVQLGVRASRRLAT